MAATASSVAPIEADSAAVPEQELASWREEVRCRARGRARRVALPPLRPLRIAALVVVLLLHAWLLLGLRAAMRHAPPAPAEAITVRLIESAAEPPLPQPLKLPPRRAPRAARPSAAPVIARAAAVEAPAAAPPPQPRPHLFNLDGSIDLPREPAADPRAMRGSFVTPAPAAEALAIMRHQRPLKVRPNHFAGNWRQSTGSAFRDFIADHLTFEQEFVLPWGTHVKCAEVFLFLAAGGGCGWETPYPYYVPTEKWKPASALDEQ